MAQLCERCETRSKTQIKRDLSKALAKLSSDYHETNPIGLIREMCDLLDLVEENAQKWDGWALNYEEAKSEDFYFRDSVGLHVCLYRMPSGRYELVAYTH